MASSRPATLAAFTIVRARTASTPARCQSQDGMACQVAADGTTRIPAGAGPGAGDPCHVSSRRQARCASMLTTFCSSTAGTRASSTRSVRLIRRPGSCCTRSRSRGCAGRKAAGSSRAPSRSGRVSSSHAAPSPQAAARILVPSAVASAGQIRASRSVPGPSGVSDVRQMAPSSMRSVGSPGPRLCTRSVRRTLIGNGASQSRVRAVCASGNYRLGHVAVLLLHAPTGPGPRSVWLAPSPPAWRARLPVRSAPHSRA